MSIDKREKLKYYIISIFIQPLVRVFASFFPLQDNKFFCISMYGKNYGDNIKSLSDYIECNKTQAIIVWGFSDSFYSRVDIPNKCKLCTFKYYYHVYTSKFVLTNFSMDYYFVSFKRKGQIFYQTWHGTALKKIGYDVLVNEQRGRINTWLAETRLRGFVKMTDVLVSSSRFMTNIYKEKFLYNKTVYEIGTPRNDLFFKEDLQITNKVKKAFSIPSSTKILLYAPTFRADRKFTYYDVDLVKIKKFWEKRFNSPCVLLVRLHANMMGKGRQFLEMFPNDTRDVSYYPDMQELLYSSDVLVTDYSSSMFDFMYLKRPIILYVRDRETYSRGFYFNIDSLPFIILNDNSEIDKKLSCYDEKEYDKLITNFINEIGSVEKGKATEESFNLLMNY